MMRKNAMISVIMPVRNGDPALLNLAIGSIRRQTYQNFEILLADDGSTEAFAAILDQIAASDGRIRLFHLPERGVSETRNYAIRQAKGEIITFLDADDEFSPVCFEEAALLLEDEKINALWGGTVYFRNREALPPEEGVRALSAEELKGCSLMMSPERLHRIRAECIGEPFRFEGGAYINRGIAGRFLRRELFVSGGHFFPAGLRLYEDTIWNLELIEDARLAYVKSVWYYYRDNFASASNSFQPELQTEMEASLGRIGCLIDNSDPVEYVAYTRFLMDSLRILFRCFYGHPSWNPSESERRRIRWELYQREPWREIGTRRYRRAASTRDRQKAILYRLHLLFYYWRVTWKNT